MKLARHGEDRLIAEITRGLPLASDVRVGVGDDCAVIGGPRAARWLLLKTDVVVEDVHFLRDDDPRRVGWKALCRAISDVAAMGGVPGHALITIAVSRDEEVARVKALYAGLRRAARKFGVSIVGGETSRSPGPMFVNVALTGSVERTRCVLRSGARPGDVLFVTGRLGGSRAGKHLDFTPRLAEARWLVQNFHPHAMMDLSDGLAADLPRLARASRCGFTLDETLLPITPGCTLKQALSDGEDFEMLIALSPKDAAGIEPKWRRAFGKLPLTRIGRVAPHSTLPSTSSGPFGNTQLSSHGHDHFADA